MNNVRLTTPIIDPSLVWQTLKQVIDPEIDCNIVDLGLVYDVAIDGAKVIVTMTLTTPGCPMHESLSWGVKNALLNLEEIEDVEVRIVWDPPWSPARMSDVARERTGLR
jgi:metal-sulfur cluster biosynthetic enzyme